MNKPLRHRVLVFGTMMVILANAAWWLNHPDAATHFSHPLWKWLIRLYGAKTGPQATDLAFFVSSLLIVLIVLVPGRIFWKRRKAVRHSKSQEL